MDRKPHIGFGNLSIEGPIQRPDHRVDITLGMNQHPNRSLRHIKEACCFDELESLVCHCCCINTYLASHLPYGVFAGIVRGHGRQLIHGEHAKGASGRSNRQLGDDGPAYSLSELKKTCVFRVDRNDVAAVLIGELLQEPISHDHRFFICECQMHASLEHKNRGRESCGSGDAVDDNVRLCLREKPCQRLRPCPRCFYRCRRELSCPCGPAVREFMVEQFQGVAIAVYGKTDKFKPFVRSGTLPYHIECLPPDRTGGSQYDDSF